MRNLAVFLILNLTIAFFVLVGNPLRVRINRTRATADGWLTNDAGGYFHTLGLYRWANNEFCLQAYGRGERIPHCLIFCVDGAVLLQRPIGKSPNHGAFLLETIRKAPIKDKDDESVRFSQ